MPKNKPVSITPESNILDSDMSRELLILISKVGNLTDQVLNRPTSIEKAIPMAFKITKESISDLYHTVNQKLSNDCPNQNNSFAIEIHFDDNTHERHPSLDSFINHHETRPKKARAVKLTWKATLFFGGEQREIQKKVGAKHQVVVHFVIPPDSLDNGDGLMYNFNGALVKAGSGVVQITINHSNKIWAVEVISHIEDFLERIKIQSPKITTTLIERRKSLSVVVEKLFDFSPIVPLAFICVVSTSTFDPKMIAMLFAQAFILLVLSLTMSHDVRLWLIKAIMAMQTKSAIIINEYSMNDFQNRKGQKRAYSMAITLIFVPIIVNFISALICRAILS